VTAAWQWPLISAAELAARLDRPELHLIECGVVYHTPPDRSDFRVESAEPLYGRPGRIPGSVSVPPRSLTDPVTHAFLPSECLRAAFEAAGVRHPGAAGDRPIVTYCGAGIAASSDAFVLTLLGARDVAVYDGSLEEWARDPSCAMESGPVAS
jgi:3-mercaptopyruvate sulfurtransferase SseA